MHLGPGQGTLPITQRRELVFMAMFDGFFRLIAAIAACALGSVTVDAAEIRADPFRGAVLEGKIEAGDFERLRSFILDGVSEIGRASCRERVYVLV